MLWRKKSLTQATQMRLGEQDTDTRNLMFMMHHSEEIETSNRCHMVHSKVCPTTDILSHTVYSRILRTFRKKNTTGLSNGLNLH